MNRKNDNGPVDMSPVPQAAPAADSRVVEGRITYSNGQPFAGAIVRAFAKTLRDEQALGDARSDDSGRYEIRYTAPAERRPVNLRVAVSDAGGREVASSGIHYDPGPRAVIDLVLSSVTRGPSEYDRYLAALGPRLEGVPLSQLKEDAEHHDITFLAGAAGIPQDRVAMLVQAAKEAERPLERVVDAGADATLRPSLGRTSASAPSSAVIPQAAFYGWFRQDLPADREGLLEQATGALKRALEASVRENIVPNELSGSIDAIVAAWDAARVAHALRPAAAGVRASLGDILGTMPEPLAEDKRRRLAATLGPRAMGPVEARTIEGAGLSADEANRVRHTLELAEITGNHLRLVQELQRMRPAGDTASLRNLAGLDERDWQNLVASHGVPELFAADSPAARTSYARQLADAVEARFPTAVFASRFAKSAPADGPLAASHADLVRFFQNNPDFDLRHTPLPAFVSADAAVRARQFAGVRNEEAAVAQLGAVQRIYKLLPAPQQARVDGSLEVTDEPPRVDRAGVVQTLLEDGLDSAIAIVWVPPDDFVSRYSTTAGGEPVARSIYSTAVEVRDSSLIKTLQLRDHAQPVLGVVLPTVATWRAMFGSVDLCACEGCASVHGPAAYFVDTLQFLAHAAKKNGTTALQALEARRPDLLHLALTCQNVNTALPYIDLVNEVLEGAVAPLAFAPIPLPLSAAADLNGGGVSADIRAAFASSANAIVLSAGASVSTIVSGARPHMPARWHLLDEGRLFDIRRSSGAIRVVSVSLQTGGTAEQLAANPEHVNGAAYTRLAAAVYPFDLPFDLWDAEATAYLRHLGVGRDEVMAALDARGPAAAARRDDVARAYLGLAPEEARIIAGEKTQGEGPIAVGPGADNDHPEDFWGYRRIGNVAPDEALRRVHVFLDRSGLHYRELLDLLGCYVVNPVVGETRKLSIVSTVADKPATCDLTKLEVQGLDGDRDTLKLIHRFVRLWRRLGWSMYELDRAILAVSPGGLTAATLVALSHIERLRRRFALPIVELLAWWTTLDAARYVDHQRQGEPEEASLYTRLFRNKIVMNPPDAAFVEDPTQLAGTLSAHAPALCAALGLNAAEVTALIADPRVVASGDTLNLRNLSQLYRFASFAHAIGSTPLRLLTLIDIVGFGPFPGQSGIIVPPAPGMLTGNTLAFLEAFDRIGDAGFAVEEVDYLLRPTGSDAGAVAVADAAIGIVLERLRGGLKKIAAETVYPVDGTGELLERELLALGWTPDAALAARQTIAGSTVNPRIFITERMARFVTPTYLAPLDSLPDGIRFPTGFAGRIDYDAEARMLRFQGSMTAAERATLEGLRPANTTDETWQAYQEAIIALAAAPMARDAPQVPAAAENVFLTAADAAALFDQERSAADRCAYALDRIGTFTRRPAREALAEQVLGPIAGLDVRAMRACRPMWNALVETAPASAASFSFSATYTEIGRQEYAREFAVVARLHKLGMLASRLEVDAGELAWLLANAQKLGGPDLVSLPAADGDAAVPFAEFANLLDYVHTRKSLIPGTPPFHWIVDLATRRPAGSAMRLVAQLAARSGWNSADVLALSATTAFPGDFEKPSTYLRLQRALQMAGRLGISGAQLADWAGAANEAIARAVKNTVKAKYDNARWLQVSGAINGRLREQRRDALVAYLLGHPAATGGQALTDPNALYQRLLIDVEMGACAVTSRLKQAIASVQLFVQRCLLNLEPDVSLSAEDATEWAVWRKQHRFWEANVKVLLDTGSYIEPELRKHKSPFFEELESELLQSEITDEKAAAALRNYLVKLDQVAKLEIACIVHENEAATDEAEGVDLLHVVGRTGALPHAYYYRTLRRRGDNDPGLWSAWERIDLDIEGDHLVPIVWNRQLYLFWPLIRDVRDQTGATTRWEIQFAWSRRDRKGWTPKKIGGDSPLRHEKVGNKTARESFYFQGQMWAGAPMLSCYGAVAATADKPAGDGYTDFETSWIATVPIGATVTGHVYTDDGRHTPIANAKVSLVCVHTTLNRNGRRQPMYADRLPDVTTDANGAFSYIEVPPEDYTLTVVVDGASKAADPKSLTTAYNTMYVRNFAFESAPSPAAAHDDDSREDDTPVTMTLVGSGWLSPDDTMVLVPASGWTLTPGPPTGTRVSGQAYAEAKQPSQRPNKLYLTEFTEPVLGATPGLFSILPLAQSRQKIHHPIFFFSDDARRYQVEMVPEGAQWRVRFSSAFHPYAHGLSALASRAGIEGVLALASQEQTDRTDVQLSTVPAQTVPCGSNFWRYAPNVGIVDPHFLPVEKVAFEPTDAYSLYNWELFFHLPLLVATQLNRNHRFATPSVGCTSSSTRRRRPIRACRAGQNGSGA